MKSYEHFDSFFDFSLRFSWKINVLIEIMFLTKSLNQIVFDSSINVNMPYLGSKISVRSSRKNS